MRRSVFAGRDDINELVSWRFETPLDYLALQRDLSVRLKSAFSELDNPGDVFLAMCSEDSSIVYYKLSEGINKPPV